KPQCGLFRFKPRKDLNFSRLPTAAYLVEEIATRIRNLLSGELDPSISEWSDAKCSVAVDLCAEVVFCHDSVTFGDFARCQKKRTFWSRHRRLMFVISRTTWLVPSARSVPLSQVANIARSPGWFSTKRPALPSRTPFERAKQLRKTSKNV